MNHYQPGDPATQQPSAEPASVDRYDPARPITAPAWTRATAALALAGSLAAITLGLYLKPDPHGYGTHRQLDIGPCGMLIVTGYPCPTCGMSTALAHTVRGQWLRALWVQPAGFILSLGAMALGVISGWTLVRGRWPRFSVPGLTPFRLFLFLLLLLLGSWVFKIATGLADGTLPYPGRPTTSMTRADGL